jgi:pyridinium-3,5-bisthiocarboxylic acid mononucleotide nickel chelatase
MSITAYFDCFAGAAGDMIVGALLDAGADFDQLQAQLMGLGVHGMELRREKVNRGGICGTKFHVDLHEHAHNHEHGDEHSHEHPHRNLADILGILDAAKLPPRTSQRARAVFDRLAQAEAKVHNVPVEQVHFHEVGAADSIADIVGACIALELLGVDEIVCSPIPLGSGTITCDHGILPVPPPATAELLIGAPTVPGLMEGELTTPTAAALLTALSASYGSIPPMQVQRVGYGAGTRTGGKVPNLLRVFVGQRDADESADTVVELSANIDDCSGEVLGATIEKLLLAGCVDAWASPITMKKSRPAWMLSALCYEADVQAAEDLLFSETTTFGIRQRVCRRSKLVRRFEIVETPYGPIRMKIGARAGRDVTASPEFAECLSAAQSHHVSVREVLTAATALWRQGQK